MSAGGQHIPAVDEAVSAMLGCVATGLSGSGQTVCGRAEDRRRWL